MGGKFDSTGRPRVSSEWGAIANIPANVEELGELADPAGDAVAHFNQGLGIVEWTLDEDLLDAADISYTPTAPITGATVDAALTSVAGLIAALQALTGSDVPTTVQGDLLYASAANVLSALAKNTTAQRALTNGGASNNPAWAQIDLTTGVTGTLPSANGGVSYPVSIAQGGTGQTGAAAAFNALAPSQGGNAGEVLATDGSNPAWTTIVEEGSGSVTLTGVTGAVTATVTWIKVGTAATGYIVSALVAQASGTSNTTAMTLTGWPAAITPGTIAPGPMAVILEDNSVLNNPGMAQLNTSGVVSFLIGNPLSLTGFTAANTKGYSQFSLTYYLQ